jgi:ABC-type antimicrobial peptide transport system permease subunit
VGVVGDVKQSRLDSSAGIATLYWPVAQGVNMGPLTMVVRTSVAPGTMAEAIANAVHEVKADVSVNRVMTLEAYVGDTLTQRNFNMQLLGVFGLLALVLCTFGIYSVLAYSVRRGMKEIGLRIAFGATKSDVLQVVMVRGMKPTAIGIVLGLAAAIALGRIVTSLVYGVSSRDLLTFFSVTVLLVLVSFVASLVPALRATRISPLAVLREE